MEWLPNSTRLRAFPSDRGTRLSDVDRTCELPSSVIRLHQEDQKDRQMSQQIMKNRVCLNASELRVWWLRCHRISPQSPIFTRRL